ncbi:MAG: acylphosphatase [Leptospiraceae bacterium]|nr:acylphosphatase [Leptospiraceae bacterium]
MKIKVYGRVQGVGYRQFAVMMARQYNIEGTVKNLSDGSVECFAKGTKENLEKFLQALKKGPPLSKVSKLETESVPPKLIPAGFEIIY